MAEIGEPDHVVRRERETQPGSVPGQPTVLPATPELEPANYGK